jgi:hypothetical protein
MNQDNNNYIKNMKDLSKFAVLTLSLAPSLASAQAITSFEGLVGKIYGMVASLVPLIVSLTLIVFLWGIFQLVRSNSEDSRKDAIKIITFGIVALFVMVSVWGLVAILSNTFFGGGIYIPQLR